jgi:hypothetical protein
MMPLSALPIIAPQKSCLFCFSPLTEKTTIVFSPVAALLAFPDYTDRVSSRGYNKKSDHAAITPCIAAMVSAISSDRLTKKVRYESTRGSLAELLLAHLRA